MDFLLEIAAGAETEEDIPQCLRTRPVLNQFQEPIYTMYRDLSGSRGFASSGVLEIPYHVKVLWLDENEVDDKDDRRNYLILLATLDGAYLKHYYDNRG